MPDYVCERCNESFPTKQKYAGHLSGYARRGKPRLQQKYRGQPVKRRGPYVPKYPDLKCPHCGQQWESYRQLAGHISNCQSSPSWVPSPFTRPDVRAKSAAAQRTPEARARRSKNAMDRIGRGESLGFGRFKDVPYYDCTNLAGEAFKVRGSWERKFADDLTALGVLWVRPKSLRYVDDEGVERQYTPDFFIPSRDEYVEVKGRFPVRDRRKMELVLAQNSVRLTMLKSLDEIDGYMARLSS